MTNRDDDRLIADPDIQRAVLKLGHMANAGDTRAWNALNAMLQFVAPPDARLTVNTVLKAARKELAA